MQNHFAPSHSSVPAAIALLVSLSAGGVYSIGAAPGDALANYVGQADDSFSWKVVERRQVRGLAIARLECVSQTWRGHVWRHQMLVVRPSQVRNTDIAFLKITGDDSVQKQVGSLQMLAERAGALATVINHIPNQPLYGGREEDALIAYTFEQYLKTGDQTWPLLFPMVKSAVRAMDVVQAFAAQEHGRKVERFVVSGASKRGWTTWLSAAADARVKAIAPMVIDMLNMKAQTQWAAQMYGRQSERIRDYTDHNLVERLDEPRMVALRQWVDPYSYRARYDIPKLLLLGTNDPYWVVDSLRHYWNDLPEPKLIYQTPNAGHNLGGGREARQTLAAFFQMVADRQPLPRMTWEFRNGATNSSTLEVNLNQPVKTFNLWRANSSDRDFRDEKWFATKLASTPEGHALAMIEKPARGFRAYLVEAELRSSTGQAYKLSSEARVIPDGPPAKSPPSGRASN